MPRITLAISLVLVTVLSLTACAQEPSAQEIVDNVIESFDNIKTYQFDMDMTQDQAGEAEGMAIEQFVTVDYSGTLDLENKQLEMHFTMTSVEPDGDEEGMGMEWYIVDGVQYSLAKHPDIEEPAWTKEAVSVQAWEMLKGMSGLDTYKELLETSQVEVIGSEKVKGIDCFMLQLTPEMAQLLQVAMGQGGMGGGGMPPIPEELLQEVFNNFSVKQWIAEDTYFPMKAEIETAMELTPEVTSYLGGEAELSMDINISYLAYNYNQPVTIVLPPEAEGLEEITEDRGPAWSPDGSRIAFTSQRDGNDEIYVMDADGSNQQRLTNDPAQDWWSSWSPDGFCIIFVSKRDRNCDVIWVMDVDGSNQQRLTKGPAED